MPKFLTYQRPAKVDKQTWGGKPGQAYGPAPKARPAGKPATTAPPAIKPPDPSRT